MAHANKSSDKLTIHLCNVCTYASTYGCTFKQNYQLVAIQSSENIVVRVVISEILARVSAYKRSCESIANGKKRLTDNLT